MGVYESWEEAKAQVDGYPDAVFKRFADRPRAEAFVRLGPPRPEPRNTGLILAPPASDIRRFMRPVGEIREAEHVEEAPVTVLRTSVTDAVPRDRTSGVAAHGAIVVYTDGSCLHQGTARAASGLGVIFPDHPAHNASLPIREDGVRATNNRAELRAIIEAFQRADTIDPGRTRTLHIHSDSEYSIKVLNQWLTAWKRMQWKRRTGEPVLNRDLLEILDRLRQLRTFRAVHVRAHTGRTDEHSRFNDLADRAANAAAAEAQRVRAVP